MPMNGNSKPKLPPMMATWISDLSLYFHIPFCTRKCDYCHFFVLPDQEEAKDKLLSGFHAEWNLLKPWLHKKNVCTLYFGGGTPSLFSPQRIKNIINLVRKDVVVADDVEITLEANPENISLDLMKAYADIGINRVSLGIQTFDPSLLRLLSRTHSEKMALDAIHMTYKAGIKNISIDLMYDLPQQTLAHWSQTLSQVKSLPITHLSLYNLTFEPHTVFFKKREILSHSLPTEDTSLEMLEMAVSELESIGLKRYEISAFAKEGYRSIHNCGYWIGRPFFGLGPSAFSYFQGKRERNIAHLNRYCKMLEEGQLPRDFSEELDPEAHRRELLAIQLRLIEGVNLCDFETAFGPLEDSIKQEISTLIQDKLLLADGPIVKLSPKGLLFYDSVAERLI